MNKNQNYPTLITENSVLVLKGGKRLVANSQHPCFTRIIEAVKRGAFNNIERLFEVKNTIEKCFNVEVINGREVFYKGHRLNNVLTDKILGCVRSGVPHKPWVKFLNNLMDNPSNYCREQLFSHVEKYGLPIDSNGFVYSWKAVNSKFRDKYTNTISYSPGRTVKIDRKLCNQHPTVACGAGLHAGSTDYVVGYGSSPNDKFVLVKFNPKNVISCPGDCDWKKLRVCELTVVRVVKREEVQPLADKYMGTPKGTNKTVKQKRNKLGQFC